MHKPGNESTFSVWQSDALAPRLTQPQKFHIVDSMFPFSPCLPHPSHPRSLRLSNDNSLSVPRIKTNAGARAFHSCAPSLWNNLLLSFRSAISVVTFKKHVKTHLFDLAFPHRYWYTPRACWCYGIVSSILLLDTDLAVVPLSLPSPGILVL